MGSDRRVRSNLRPRAVNQACHVTSLLVFPEGIAAGRRDVTGVRGVQDSPAGRGSVFGGVDVCSLVGMLSPRRRVCLWAIANSANLRWRFGISRGAGGLQVRRTCELPMSGGSRTGHTDR